MVALIRSPNAGRQDALGRVPYPVVRLSRFGLATGDAAAAANRTAFQAAVDKAIASRTWLVNDLPAGTYPLAKAGTSNPYTTGRNFCVNIGDGTIGFRLIGNPRAVIRLGTGQMTGNSTPCDLFIGRNLVDCEFDGGTYDGGSGFQADWTGGYVQNGAGAFHIWATTANGRGCDNVRFRNMRVQYCFGNPFNIGIVTSFTTAGNRTSGEILFDRCVSFQVGEGPQAMDARVVRYHRCHVDNTANTIVGDFYEPARTDWFEVIGCTTTSPQISAIGSHVDCYGSVAGKVEDCVFVGGNDGLATQESSGTVRRVDVIRTTFENCRTVIATCAERTHVKLTDCTLRGCGTVSTPPIQAGVTDFDGNSEVGAVVEIDGGHIEACYPIQVSRNGTLLMKNRPVISNAVAEAIQVTRADSNVPHLDLDVDVRNPTTHAVTIHGGGSAFAPTGRIRGSWRGAVNNRFIVPTSGGSPASLDVNVELPTETFSFFNYVDVAGHKVIVDPDYDPGLFAAGTIVGSLAQEILLMGRAATRSLANSSSLQLTTSSLSLNTKTTLKIRHVGAGVWREVERQVGA